MVDAPAPPGGTKVTACSAPRLLVPPSVWEQPKLTLTIKCRPLSDREGRELGETARQVVLRTWRELARLAAVDQPIAPKYSQIVLRGQTTSHPLQMVWAGLAGACHKGVSDAAGRHVQIDEHVLAAVRPAAVNRLTIELIP